MRLALFQVDRDMKGRLFFFVALVWALILAGTAGVAGQTLPNHFDPSAREPSLNSTNVPSIRFLTTPGFPPFNYRDASGELVGFNIDLARAICDNLDVVCTMQAWPWQQAADALADNQGDALIAGLAITGQNGLKFDFSQIYLMLPGRFIAPKARAADFDPLRLQDRRLGVRQGSNHALFVRRYLSVGEMVEYESEFEVLDALASGEVDVYFGDGMRASFWLSQNPDCCTFVGESYFNPDLFGQGLAVAFPAGHDLVRSAVNLALNRLHRNGTLDDLYLRWFPVGFY